MRENDGNDCVDYYGFDLDCDWCVVHDYLDLDID